MKPLFIGVPQPLPSRSDLAIVVDFPGRPDAPKVRHAHGYESFVHLAADYGTPARDLFELWRFAHFVRAHAAAFRADSDLQRSAVVFLGNALIALHPNTAWQHDVRGLAVESDEPPTLWVGEEAQHNPHHRRAQVDRIVEALLEADERRFHEFHPTVHAWRVKHEP